MRYSLIALLLVLSADLLYSQGKADANTNKTACLLIRNDNSLSGILSSLNTYKGYSAVKLKDFNGAQAGLDSILELVCKTIDPKIILFESCNLYDLTEPLTAGRLEELHILKGCTFFENSLFHAFRNTPVKTLYVRYGREGFKTDSIQLLPQLSLIKISSKTKFRKLNRSRSYTLYKQGIAHTVTLNYYEKLYKKKKEKYKPPFEPTRFIDNEEDAPSRRQAQPVPYTCVKQPIPGIRINDTLYSFDAGQEEEFYYSSGSRIMLDKNAFVTTTGDTYKGPVTLFYREFRNPVEILLSGIPMKNKVNGEERLFKSGGMYEVQAYDVAGNELKTRSDTSLKVNFALTDTAASFAFYSLNRDGSWTTTADKVTQVISPASRKDTVADITMAVREYYEALKGYKMIPDTTRFEERFGDRAYLYTYREDNVRKSKKDSSSYSFGYVDGDIKGYLVLKYVKQTKNKEIIFKFAESKRYFGPMPAHIRCLLNQTLVYTGTMDKSTFMSTYHKKLYVWDVRCEEPGNGLRLNLKTSKNYVQLPCEVVALFQKKYTRYPKESHALAVRFNKLMGYEARYFNKKSRYHETLNNLNYGGNLKRDMVAYRYSKKFQTQEELKLDYEGWKKYVKKVAPQFHHNSFQNDNAVGYALLKSGMGVKNIDCYIHSGEMENVFVNYKNVNLDTLSDQYHAVLYKTINTSQPLSLVQYRPNALQGYYFKGKPNYIIRLSQDGFMQVTRNEEILGSKQEESIKLTYESQHYVKGMDSNAITRLILKE